MNDVPEGLKRGRPRCTRAGAFALLAALLAGTTVWAQSRPAATPVTTGPAATTAVRKAPVPKSPRLLADEIVPILRRKKTPWQLYPSYAQLFQTYAEQEKAVRVTTERAVALQTRMVAHLTGMANLLLRMGEQAKARQSIQHGTSSVPPEKRQETFVQAGVELERLLVEFSRMAAMLPAGRARAPAGG